MFNKDKDLILRIMNGVFIFWLVIALVFVVNSGLNLIMYQEKLTYQSFQDSGCSEYPYYEKIEEFSEEQCKAEYVFYERSYAEQINQSKVSLYTTLFQLVFVSGTLYIINRKK